MAMEHAWRTARAKVAGQHCTSQAPRAVDLLAALPLVSATTLARALDIAIKSALRLLDAFCGAGIAVEVTHRSARRLFGMAGLAPLRDGVRPPPSAYEPDDPEPPPLPPVTPIERRPLDYTPLETALAEADQTIRRTWAPPRRIARPRASGLLQPRVQGGGHLRRSRQAGWCVHVTRYSSSRPVLSICAS